MSNTNQKHKLTTAFGIPVANDQNSLTAGERGPVLMQDVHLLEKLAHFDRERIPERVVHAKGAGAGGYFEVTADVTKYTKAKFLSEIGKRTEVFARFSTVGGEKGSADAERDPRGFALKFYTEEGNYDLVGNNTPSNSRYDFKRIQAKACFLIFRNHFMILRVSTRHIIRQINDERRYSFRQLGYKQNRRAEIAVEKTVLLTFRRSNEYSYYSTETYQSLLHIKYCLN